MTNPVDLERIEKKTWASYYEDGLSDIGMGIIMLAMGLFIIHSYSGGFWLICLMGGATVSLIGKGLITYPRMGRVDLTYKFPGKRRQMFIWIFCLVIGSLFIVVPSILTIYLQIPGTVEGLIAGIGFFVLFGSLACLPGNRHLYAYGLLMGISMVLAKSMDNSVGEIMTWASGVLMVLIGLAMTVRFLRKYPKSIGVSGTEAAKDSS